MKASGQGSEKRNSTCLIMVVIDPPPAMGDPTVGSRESWGLVQSPHPRGETAGVLPSLLPGDSKSPRFSLPHGRQGVASLKRRPQAQRCWQLEVRGWGEGLCDQYSPD